jgi:hypothetical protein
MTAEQLGYETVSWPFFRLKEDHRDGAVPPLLDLKCCEVVNEDPWLLR